MCPQIGVRTYGPSVLDRRLGCRFRNVIPGRLDEVDARRWHVEVSRRMADEHRFKLAYRHDAYQCRFSNEITCNQAL